MVVEFYKPTCKHCLALVPIYEKIGMEFQSNKPPGNIIGVKTCRFDAAEKDKVRCCSLLQCGLLLPVCCARAVCVWVPTGGPYM